MNGKTFVAFVDSNTQSNVFINLDQVCHAMLGNIGGEVTCRVSLSDGETIVLSGEGAGLMSQRLLERSLALNGAEIEDISQTTVAKLYLIPGPAA